MSSEEVWDEVRDGLRARIAKAAKADCAARKKAWEEAVLAEAARAAGVIATTTDGWTVKLMGDRVRVFNPEDALVADGRWDGHVITDVTCLEFRIPVFNASVLAALGKALKGALPVPREDNCHGSPARIIELERRVLALETTVSVLVRALECGLRDVRALERARVSCEAPDDSEEQSP